MGKATYEDISKLTGFSIATISRCFRNTANVKPDTRSRVMEAARQLGIDTTGIEEGARKSNLIIFNIPSLENPFYSTIIRGARQVAERNGFDLLINECHIRAKTVGDVIDLLRRTRAAGLITANCVERNILERLRQVVPVVQCCECHEGMDIPLVTVDDESAAEKACAYLLSLGRRRIAFLNGPGRYKYARCRERGYRKALEKAGIKVDESLIVNIESVNFEMAVASAQQLLNSSVNRPDAFFTISDVYAAAAIKAISKEGLSVPDDISVVGFDNIEFSSMVTPAITTVSQPMLRIGMFCADLICKEINHQACPNKYIVLDTELIIRESTAQKRA